MIPYFLWLFTFVACEGEDIEETIVRNLVYTFETDGMDPDDETEWQGGFADYPVGEEDFFELRFVEDVLPEPLDQGRRGLLLAGSNRSDDLFMFIKKEVTDLQPLTRYAINFDIRLASDAPEESVGIGGSPGASVYLKAGATTIEPVPESVDGYWQMNIDKGNQSQGGEDMRVIGNVGTDQEKFEYTLIERSTDQPILAETGADGNLWVIIGTDSGFEGKTTLYYDRIAIELTPYDDQIR
jgi:hypothetical protein